MTITILRASHRAMCSTSALGTDNLFQREHFRTTLGFAVTNLTNKDALYNFLSTFSGTHFVQPRAYQTAIGLVF